MSEMPDVDPLEVAIGAMLMEHEESDEPDLTVLAQRIAAVVRESQAERAASPDLTLIAALVDAAGGQIAVLREHMERANQGSVQHREEPLTGALIFTRKLPLILANKLI